MKFSELDYDYREILFSKAHREIEEKYGMESTIARKFVDNFNSHFNYELSEFQIRYHEYDPQIRDIFDHQKEELEKRFNVSFDWDKY